MRVLLVVFGCSLLMASSTESATMQSSKTSQKSQKSVSDILERAADAHGKEKLSRTDMIAEGTVTVTTGKRSTLLKVRLAVNGGQESQRILLEQAGTPWDGRGETLTPEGQRALDFLQTQFARGPRELLKASAGASGITVSDSDSIPTPQELSLKLKKDDGDETSYFLDSGTSRLAHLEFQQGQQLDVKGRFRPTNHSYVYSDYRVADGIVTPYRIEHDTNSVKLEELQLVSVRYIPTSSDRKQ